MSELGRAATLTQGAFRSFGRLPKPLRRLVTRAVSPNWTVGAVAIIERDGQWLMVDPVYRKGWTLPGGLIDSGETPAAAVERELVEELGVDVEVNDAEPWILMDSAMRRIDVVFCASITENVDPASITIHTPELSGVGWFSPDDLPETDREAGDVILLIEQVRAGGSCVLVL
tara:strand:- start:21 stop:536 length:516 start_codon:yes stop_codon:yes gene_type:complete